MKRPVPLLVAVALLSACGGERTPTEATATRVQSPAAAMTTAQSREPEHGGPSTLRQDLATLRRVTAPFHDFKVAAAAGWSAQITPCMVDPGGAGGMGFHYGNTALIDGSVRVDQPELLLYEPERHGRLRLVAVEYIIPYTAHSRDAAPPVLFGQQFLQNDTFQLWGLHVWVWKENPSGLFANWNPRVSCDETHDVARMAH
jgi:hypothetical protein